MVHEDVAASIKWGKCGISMDQPPVEVEHPDGST